MSVIPDFKAGTIFPFLTRNVALGATIYTDGLKSFSGLTEAGFQHIVRIQPIRSELRKGAKSAVPLSNRAIGNLQQWLIGTHDGVSKHQLQVYLDEFVFRLNRRKTPAAAFQPLLGTDINGVRADSRCQGSQTSSYWSLLKQPDNQKVTRCVGFSQSIRDPRGHLCALASA